MLPNFKKLWKYMEENIFTYDSTKTLFNQYRDIESDYDIANGNEIRKQNLYNYFSSFNECPKYVMIGEAPGPNGCRFTGVPFTNEKQLLMETILPFKGQKTSKAIKPYAGTAAKMFWDTLHNYHPKFLAWDCIMYHPRKENEPLSIRAPRRREIMEHAPHLKGVLSIMHSITPIAIGRKAEKALGYLNIDTTYIRHPSRGGKKEFQKGIKEIFN